MRRSTIANYEKFSECLNRDFEIRGKCLKLIESLEKEIELQDRIIENCKSMIKNYDRKIEILEELLRRKEEENATLAQRLNKLSSAAATDSSVEGAMRDSELSGEGSHA